MVENPLGDGVDAEALEHAVADLGMAFEHEPLRVRERPGLAEDLLRDGELSEVVQARGKPGQLDLSGSRPIRVATRAASSATRSEWLPS